MHVLYITHYSIMEPLGQSQILPYLTGLASRGHSIKIFSFEKPVLFADEGRIVAQQQALQRIGMGWLPHAYRRGSSLRNLARDVLASSAEVNRLHKRSNFELIHCRSHVPFLMAWYASMLHRVPLLLDFRGFMAEEYVDAGLWRPGGARFRLAKLIERRMCARCASLVVLTHPMRDYVQRVFVLPSEKVFVVPCCVDTGRFFPKVASFTNSAPAPLRVIYSGSTHGRYDLQAMLRFFAVLARKRPGSRLTILSTGDLTSVQTVVTITGVPSEAVTLRSVNYVEVPGILSDHDIGLFFLRGNLALLAASPTKIGEYLACGLCVVAEKGTGGLEEILVREGVGCLVDSSDPSRWSEVADEVIRLCDNPDRRLKSARIAAKHYSLEDGIQTYARAYEFAARHRP